MRARCWASTTPEAQDRLAARVVAEGISVRGLEEIVAVGDGEQAERQAARAAARPRPARPTWPRGSPIASTPGCKVDLGKRKGKITVEFASLPTWSGSSA